MTDACPLDIPADLDRLHPNDITEWLRRVGDDETISDADADVDRARKATWYALGIG